MGQPSDVKQPVAEVVRGTDTVTFDCPSGKRLGVVSLQAQFNVTTPTSGTVTLRQGSAGGTIRWAGTCTGALLAQFNLLLTATRGSTQADEIVLPVNSDAVLVCTGAELALACKIYDPAP
jgi:hypothetical protein